jgi:hypothetical protein
MWRIMACTPQRRQQCRRSSAALSPSEALHDCPRAQVYAAKGKQRMRTGGNTRQMQQMQQQMVGGPVPWRLPAATNIGQLHA